MRLSNEEQKQNVKTTFRYFCVDGAHRMRSVKAGARFVKLLLRAL